MTAVLLPGTPVLIDTEPGGGSMLFRRDDRGVVERYVLDVGWIVRVNGLSLRFDDVELIRADRADRGSALTATTLLATVALGLLLLAGGVAHQHLDRDCHARSATPAAHDLCERIAR